MVPDWQTGLPSLHLNLDDATPYVTYGGNILHKLTPVRSEKIFVKNTILIHSCVVLAKTCLWKRANCFFSLENVHHFWLLFQHGMGFETTGYPDYINLGDWSHATCFANVESCTTGIFSVHIMQLCTCFSWDNFKVLLFKQASWVFICSLHEI